MAVMAVGALTGPGLVRPLRRRTGRRPLAL